MNHFVCSSSLPVIGLLPCLSTGFFHEVCRKCLRIVWIAEFFQFQWVTDCFHLKLFPLLCLTLPQQPKLWPVAVPAMATCFLLVLLSKCHPQFSWHSQEFHWIWRKFDGANALTMLFGVWWDIWLSWIVISRVQFTKSGCMQNLNWRCGIPIGVCIESQNNKNNEQIGFSQPTKTGRGQWWRWPSTKTGQFFCKALVSLFFSLQFQCDIWRWLVTVRSVLTIDLLCLPFVAWHWVSRCSDTIQTHLKSNVMEKTFQFGALSFFPTIFEPAPARSKQDRSFFGAIWRNHLTWLRMVFLHYFWSDPSQRISWLSETEE